MRFRPIQTLLLASLVFWTTGAAMNLHERLEHSEEAIARAAQAEHSSGSQPGKHHDPHDHDDCPTCQLLAHMQADRVAPPGSLCVLLPIHHVELRPDRRPLIVEALTFAPIRGPPGTDSISI